MRKAFTLIELLVVIVIIGVLASLAVVAVNSSRAKSRDAKRVSDLKQIATALELYYADHTSYPSIITPGQPLVSTDGANKTYMAKVPSNPTPRAEEACADLDYQYAGSGDNYSLIGCLAKAVGDTPAGARKLEKSGTARNLGPTNGIVGWWMFDGLHGTKDLSGINNNGAIVGAVATSTGRYGENLGSYFFSSIGSDQAVQLSSLKEFSDNTAYSLSIYLKWSGSGGPAVLTYSFPFGADANNLIGLVNNNADDAFRWGVYFRYESVGIISIGPLATLTKTMLTDGNWHHLVISVKGTDTDSIDVFIDGGARKNNIVNVTNTATKWRLFGRTYTSSHNWLGYMSDVRLYDRALTQAEVQALYDATRP